MNYTLHLNELQLATLEKVYHEYLLPLESPHVLFHGVHNKILIIAYKSGVVVLQGKNISLELQAIKKILNITAFPAIGADEVGTGDVFGPIVVCSAYVSVENIEILENLGVKDSKTMTDQMIIRLAPQLSHMLPHTLIILSPEKYNEVYKKGNNLNKIKAFLHNISIIKTTNRIKEDITVILDQFCTSAIYYNYLAKEPYVYKNIEFVTKGERAHIAVAAASIIARYAFLVKMSEYSKEYNIHLLKGAGTNCDDLAFYIFNEYGLETLSKLAKMNYKNITKQHFE